MDDVEIRIQNAGLLIGMGRAVVRAADSQDTYQLCSPGLKVVSHETGSVSLQMLDLAEVHPEAQDILSVPVEKRRKALCTTLRALADAIEGLDEEPARAPNSANVTLVGDPRDLHS